MLAAKLYRLPSRAIFIIRALSNQVFEPSGSGTGTMPQRVGGSSYEEEFRASQHKLATLGEHRRDVRLQLYALFQQATVGKCTNAKPALLDFDSQSKWDAWKQIQNMPSEEAKKRYIDLVKSMTVSVSSSAGPAGATTSGTAAGSSSRSFYSRSAALQAAVLEDWSDQLKVVKKGHVIYVRFNRPAKKNALTLQMYDEIAFTLENAAQDPEVYLVVFTGEGDYYCSGNDLSNLTSIDPHSVESQTKEIKAIIKNFVQSFIDFPKPLVALVNGPAVGIAVSILGLFDAVYAVDTATFHTPFMQLGQVPVGCASYVFPRIMGGAKAGEMLMFNRKLTAQGAVDRNLVTQVFPEDVFHRETEALVAGFASLPPEGLHISKMLLRKSEREKLHEVNEEECESLLDWWKSEECWNAVMTVARQKLDANLDDV